MIMWDNVMKGSYCTPIQRINDYVLAKLLALTKDV